MTVSHHFHDLLGESTKTATARIREAKQRFAESNTKSSAEFWSSTTSNFGILSFTQKYWETLLTLDDRN